MGLRGEQLDEHLHLLDEGRGERLHPLDGDPGRELVGDLGELGVLPTELGRAAAYVVGQQELSARWRPQALDPTPLLQRHRALVGHVEAADLLDLVTEELHPQGVLLGGREHIDDAATHGELAALLDQVDAGVRRAGQPTHDVLELDLLTRDQLDRREVRQALDLRLEHRSHGGHDHLQRTVPGLVARMLDPAEHREASADGVAARAEPLVRQRLPRRVEGHRRRVQDVGQLLGEILGLPDGRGHDQDGPAGVDQPLDDEGPQRGRPGQVERGEALLGVLHRGREGRLAQDKVGQGGKTQRGSAPSWCRHAQRPPNQRGEGVMDRV